jgi:arylsulfatase A-like enzyme
MFIHLPQPFNKFSFMLSRLLLITTCFLLSMIVSAQKQQRPNIIFILTDDMGFGDIGCFNGTYKTPNIDRMAAEGRKFTSYYSASPICSPSRVGYLTGMHPAKWNITSFLQKKADNRLCEQADYLDPSAPGIAKVMKANGYATAHFGKWHMGGGRDVDDAPSIQRYGFDEWSSTWESPDPDPLLTATDWIWSDKDSVKRWNRTKYWVEKTLAFMQKHKGRPCYINLWPDDVHTPWVPGDDSVGRYPGKPEEEKSFVGVLTEYDKQIGRLFEGLKKLGLDENTIVVFTSDNGPLPNFRHDRSASLRGTKLSLYEGGIRMPFIIRWPGTIKPGTTDSTSVICANDLLPSFSSLAGIRLPLNKTGDGENRGSVLLGKPALRSKMLFWEYGRNETVFKYPPRATDRSPSLAVRRDRWKLLMNADGSKVELYDIVNDRDEKNNLAVQKKDIVKSLSSQLLAWWNSLPRLKPA